MRDLVSCGVVEKNIPRLPVLVACGRVDQSLSPPAGHFRTSVAVAAFDPGDSRHCRSCCIFCIFLVDSLFRPLLR